MMQEERGTQLLRKRDRMIKDKREKKNYEEIKCILKKNTLRRGLTRITEGCQ